MSSASAASRGTGLTLGLDIGGTKLLGVLCRPDGSVLGEAQRTTQRQEGPRAVIGRCLELINELQPLSGGQPILGLGGGFAGLVDGAQGRISSSIMLPGWDDHPLAAELGQALQLPVFIDNDANTAAYGEWVALGRPLDRDLLVVTVGTGIGGALVLGGKLHRGAAGMAGEIGNTSVDLHGPECWCGSRGCLNMLASGSALSARHAAMTRQAALPVAEIGRLAATGDGQAREVLEAGAIALGAGLANAINLLNPDHIGLCGGVVELGPAWLERVRQECARRAFKESFRATSIERCRLGNGSGAIGAALMAMDRISGALEAPRPPRRPL